MAIFEIEGPDGAIYEVDAPDEQSAIAGFQQAMGGEPDPQNPDGTYGQPPEGMVFNPETGQMEDLRSPINPNIPTGRANAAALGAGQGLGFNMLDEAVAGASTLLGGDYDYNLGRMREAERRAADDHPVAYYGGTVGGAIGTGTGLASGGMSLGANAINAGWRLPGVAAASGVEGGIMGALYGAGAGETADERLSGAKTGGAWGLGLGAAAPYVVEGASRLARRAITPFRTSPERTAAANLLQSEGVPLTAGQRTGNNWLRYRESELGGARAADRMEDQARAFTDAAMRRAGGSGLADPDNLAAIGTRIGQGFDDVSARNMLRIDQGVLDDMNAAAREYARVLPADKKAIFQNLGNDIAGRFRAGQGTMSGKDYQVIRSRLSRMAQNYRNSDGEFADAIRGLRNALDKGMERSINPSDAGVWQELRRQYGNYKTLTRAAGGGGEAAGLGVISPAQLRVAASSGNREGFNKGASEFTKLAKAGQAIMTPLPNSGTAQRMAAQGIAAAIMGGGGAAAAGPFGFAAGLAGPALVGRALMSGPVQSYLANQAVTGALDPMKRAIMNAILTGNTSALAPRLPAP